MESRSLRFQLLGPVPAISLAAIFLIASFLLVPAARNDELFGNYYSSLIMLNVIGVIVLTLLIILNVWRLIRQFRARVLGSRLTLRFVAAFSVLTLVPLVVIYFFAVNFLSRGIDNWFDVHIEQALDDALLLGRSSLETIKYDVLDEVRDAANLLARAESGSELIGLMDELREQGEFSQMSLHSKSGRILPPWSSSFTGSLIPDSPDESVLSMIRRGFEYAQIEPVAGGNLQLRVAVPVPSSRPMRVLQVIYPLPLRHSRLGASIQSATAEFQQLKYLRDPLKFNFVLTLSLVALMTTLIALWVGIFLTRRLVAPLGDLAEGTRAVARGNYQTQLPVTSSDELGILVHSFNEMTGKISVAQNALHQSRQHAEKQHAYLDTVLTHLSSGVISFDPQGKLRTHNAGAERILSASLSRFEKHSIDHIGTELPEIEPLLSKFKTHMQRGQNEWHEQITLTGRLGQQTLICTGTRLPESTGDPAGYVIVFDDASDLINAQRDAAWGEVARRLAHEIKNPLTPIQLSAERIRRKFLAQIDGKDREDLDRATRTIIEQVESMKSMVNAFSEYAQPVQLRLDSIDLNQLIRDVVELCGQHTAQPEYICDLENDLPSVMGDPTALRQVLNNLIINARDALIDTVQGQVRIRTQYLTHHDRNLVRLDLSDNGPGFPEHLLGQIFEPYVTTREKGTGLGLAISRRLITELGGQIRVENKVDVGANVIIHLQADTGQDESHSHVE